MLSEAMGITIEKHYDYAMFKSRPLFFYFSFSRPEKMSVAAGNKNHLIRLIAVY
ncbi:chloride transporter chloride channel (ClC) family [Klebsiella pneumoniae]|uniref:Chloride transporter chloride channel (ClC) family n=1 Tax=Klebsiella pneumoniae TaxID=573 RepID=A0A2X3CL81_KLEPN|nr:chloride transporter chloride channel (ClC) family [Klebsiella pneumoniae]